MSYLVEVQSPPKVPKNSWEDNIHMTSLASQIRIPTCTNFILTTLLWMLNTTISHISTQTTHQYVSIVGFPEDFVKGHDVHCIAKISVSIFSHLCFQNPFSLPSHLGFLFGFFSHPVAGISIHGLVSPTLWIISWEFEFIFYNSQWFCFH